MNPRRLKKRTDASPPPTDKRKRRVFLFILMGGAIVALALSLFKPEGSFKGDKHPTEGNLVSGTSDLPAESFNALIGRWTRPDGGYILEIRHIGSDGKMDAGYFNPKPIYVAESKASVDSGSIGVFIKLQDVGYPGSYYRLLYKQQKDILEGLYYQAALGQNFGVVFVRK